MFPSYLLNFLIALVNPKCGNSPVTGTAAFLIWSKQSTEGASSRVTKQHSEKLLAIWSLAAISIIPKLNMHLNTELQIRMFMHVFIK